MTVKFDFCIGNPAYQDQTVGENTTYAPQIYHKFLDAAFDIADKVEMIHPARFLFNAGSTPRAWNESMLNNPHFKVLDYEEDATKIFPSTEIKGGVAITFHDKTQNFGSIKIFTKYTELNSILQKVIHTNGFSSFSEIVITRTAYRLTDKLHAEHPEALSQLSSGHPYDMSTNIFERLPQVFYSQKPLDSHRYVRILGRENNERVYKYIRTDYVNEVENLYKYKVIIPSANGAGSFGETLSQPLICPTGDGSTETFISIGAFNSEPEAQRCLKYIRTKFARALLGVLKTTQHITPSKWQYVPNQVFSRESDIDWSVPVAAIDKQLYKKYGLTPEEIHFIETHVKEME